MLKKLLNIRKKNTAAKKPRIAIFDFTDCEGCEVKIVSLRERLLDIANRVEIVNWRLGQEKNDWGHFDVTLIEGTPLGAEEVELLEYLREHSGFLIALGSCATLGGIPAIMDKNDRKKWYKKIYGTQYKPRGIDALPLQAYVQIDYQLHGCPVNEDEVMRIMEDLLSQNKPRPRGFSVCYECKQARNPCRLIHGKPCLGPITQGGCKAICVSGGSPCYGCFGLRDEAQIKGLLSILNKITDRKTIDRYFTMFLRQTKAYNEIVKPAIKAKGGK